MIKIHRILCPTDFSEISKRAFDHALALARFYQAQIELVHVVEPLLHGLGVPRFYPSWSALNATVLEDLEKSLTEMAAPAKAFGIPVERGVWEGGTVASILDWARRLPADLLVMGTHGRGGFERFLLGSVTEKVLRQAPCPVLTVPPPAKGIRPHGSALLDSILCPVDFSGASLHALRYALSLAQESRAQLTVLHVLEWFGAGEGGLNDQTEWFDLSEYRRRMEQAAGERLDAVVPDEARAWCSPQSALAWGRPWREILSQAGRQNAELIVMGTRGRGAVDVGIFGSTSERVVRAAACPVMVIHTD